MESSIESYLEELYTSWKEFIPTGLPSFDISIGGLPKGGVVEIIDSNCQGKTYLALQFLKEMTRTKYGLFVDLENRLCRDVFIQLGINVDNLLVLHPYSGEEAISSSILFSDVDLIVLDTLASIHSTTQHSRFLRTNLPPLISSIRKNKTTLVLLNQKRWNPRRGSIPTAKRSIFPWIDMTIEIQSGGTIELLGYIVGEEVEVTTTWKENPLSQIKNRYSMYYQQGYCQATDVIRVATQKNIMERRGSNYYYSGNLLGGSLQETRYMIIDNPELLDILYRKCISD